MLLFWALVFLPYLASAAVIPDRQVGPFEDPPPLDPQNFFSSDQLIAHLQKREAVDRPYQDFGDIIAQEIVMPERFLLKRGVEYSSVPLQEYSDGINGLSERRVLYKDSPDTINVLPERFPQRRIIPFQNVRNFPYVSYDNINRSPERIVSSQDTPNVVDVLPERFRLEQRVPIDYRRNYLPTPSDRINELPERIFAAQGSPVIVDMIPERYIEERRLPAEDFRNFPQESSDPGNDPSERRVTIQESPVIIDILPEEIEERTDPVENSRSSPQVSPDTINELPEGSVPQKDSFIVVNVLPERFVQESTVPAEDSKITHEASSETSNYIPERSILQQDSSDNVDVLQERLSNKNSFPEVDSGGPQKVSSGMINILSERRSSSQESPDILPGRGVIDLVDPLPEKFIQKRAAPIDTEPEFALTDAPHYFAQLFRHKRTSSPAVDSVDENSSQWRPHNLPKAQFVTKRGPIEQSPSSVRTYNDRSGLNPSSANGEIANYRNNEIPLPERDLGRYPESQRRYEYREDDAAAFRGRDDRLNEYDSRRLGPRRIIYYADLPEIVRPHDSRQDPRQGYRGPEGGEYGRYDLARSSHKFPRESRYDDSVVRSPPPGLGRDDRDRYRDRYRPAPNPSSYTIIDAERAPVRSPVRAPYTQRPYPDIDTQSRYNRIPAPYQQGQPEASPPPPYEQFRKPGGVPPRLTVGPAPGRRDEPYRDYNPHQPAHWSMQIGTSLTVKDDGRPYNSGRRFYVHSQDQQPYSPSRYPRVEDDPRHRL